MKLVKSAKSMQKLALELKKQGKTVGFVPTMGYLHEGHLSLIRRARKENDIVVVSIYVNPIQFGPREDFKEYPRDLKRDLKLCEQEKVDIVFAPSDKEMYPEGFCTYVEVTGRLTSVMCGAFRPGHFKGVTTVVAKLFNIVMPDVAYFGQKDPQQAVVIKRMVKDLNFPVKIKVLPIVREPDGLAMSSRNTYLSPEERQRALCLYKALKEAEKMVKSGETNVSKIIKAMRKIIEKADGKIDYIVAVDPETLEDFKKLQPGKKVMFALAVRIGKTRLIDNMIFTPPGGKK